jgi:hypothetical protein
MSTTIYESFINSNVAPYSAAAIGIFNSNGELVNKIPIDGFKPSYTDRLFRFGILSDVHNNNADSQSTEDIADFANALNLFNEMESVNMTCICGDITQGGRPAQFAVYQSVVEENSFNTSVYTTTGNHDCPSSGGLAITDWEPYTGNPMTFEVIKQIGGKNIPFLFLGMNLYSLGDAGTPYLDTDLDWLEEKLEEYRNERVFVITHLFFPTKAGNFKQIYPGTNWLGGAQLTRLQAMNERYLNSIWFSGHSHWKWYLQKYEDKANVYRSYDDNGNPTCGWTVHIPSCASPIDSNGVSSRVSKPLESEGGIIDVYNDYIVLRGVVFKKEGDAEYTNKYEPIAQYKLDTTLITIPALEPETPVDPDAPIENYVRAEHFDLNTAKANGDLDLIMDLPDDYVQITFNNKNQSYWVRSDSWSADATSCTIELEDLIVEDANGNVITKPDYVGFYDRTYSQKVDQYRIADNEAIVITESGSNKRAQFGSSSSYNYGTCVIKMKFKLKYTV